MSITFKLYVNGSPKNKIVKTLSNEKSFDCLLKEDTSIMDPVLILESDTPLTVYNYMVCEAFNRTYFITNIESVGNDLWRITAHEDVLDSFASSIKGNKAVIRRQERLYNLYLDDPDFHVYNYERIQTLQFPENAFTKDLQYILVTNGAGSSSKKGGEKDVDTTDNVR